MAAGGLVLFFIVGSALILSLYQTVLITYLSRLQCGVLDCGEKILKISLDLTLQSPDA